MEIQLNGKPLTLTDGTTQLVDFLQSQGVSLEARGVAVALNDEVVPRMQWADVQLQPNDRVEIVTARQGG